MLDLKCDKCGLELREPGALLFSPPRDGGWLVEKLHLCRACWAATLAFVKPGQAGAAEDRPRLMARDSED